MLQHGGRMVVRAKASYSWADSTFIKKICTKLILSLQWHMKHLRKRMTTWWRDGGRNSLNIHRLILLFGKKYLKLILSLQWHKRASTKEECNMVDGWWSE
ncbi:hypothetical protein CDAR_617801 [Caerostris darwini]|uniref:Uncharacterized protein n=1 Tax=Caerostris darwini TaxID=1538125 RepID=A0AAV4Q0V0_9ARAC|nr:hypothetical protein CDAR_617801 [Caerostris darwini]